MHIVMKWAEQCEYELESGFIKTNTADKQAVLKNVRQANGQLLDALKLYKVTHSNFSAAFIDFIDSEHE